MRSSAITYPRCRLSFPAFCRYVNRNCVSQGHGIISIRLTGTWYSRKKSKRSWDFRREQKLMFNEIFLAFIPIFVAVDPIGLLPLFVALTHRVTKKEKRKIILQSVATALSFAIAFIVLGKWMFRVVWITVWDFMIAGGVILLCLSISDLLQPWKERPNLSEELGAVPLGTPLIVGPAVLTTSLIMIED